MAAVAVGSISTARTVAAPARAAAIAVRPLPDARSSTDRPATLGGMIEQIPRQPLTAGPGKGPERRRLVAAVLALGQLPQPDRLFRLEQRELGNERDRLCSQMGADECGQGLGHKTILTVMSWLATVFELLAIAGLARSLTLAAGPR